MKTRKTVRIGRTWATAELTSHGVVFKKMGVIQRTARNLYGVLFNAETPETGVLVLFCVALAVAEIVFPFVACGA